MPVLEDAGRLPGRLLRPAPPPHPTRPAGPLTDDQLRSIDVPAHFLRGAKSEVFPSGAVRARVEALVPKATVETVADAGHAVATSHTELVADHLTAFLGGQ